MAGNYIISQYAMARQYVDDLMAGRDALPRGLDPDLARRIKMQVAQSQFPDQVARNPRGLGDQPPPSPVSGEMRSANTPMGDVVAQATGSPLAGRVATGVDRHMQRMVDLTKAHARTVGNVAYGATGIPMAAEGGENLARAVQSGDKVRGAAAAAQIGLSALPVVGPAARAAFATAPRAMGMVGAMGAAPVLAGQSFSGPAEAQESGSQPQGADGRLRQLLTQRASLDQQRRSTIAERDAEAKGQGASGGKAGRGPNYTRLTGEIERIGNEMVGLDAMIKQATIESSPEFQLQMKQKQDEAAAAKKAKDAATPFRERYPEVAAILPAVGLGLSAGLPFALRTVGNVRSWLPGSYPSRMSKAIRDTEAAIARNDPMAATAGAKRLQSMIDSKPGAVRSALSEGGKAAAAAGAGGALTAEANMFPDQYDAFNLPEGDAKERARASALSLPAYLERGAVGTLTGLSGYKAGDIIPKRTPDIDRAKAAAGILSPNYLADVQTITRNLRGEPQNLLAEAQKAKVVTKDKSGKYHDERGYFTSGPKRN